MDASEERQAFARGIADFCSRNGCRGIAVPLAKFAECSDAFELDPAGFAAGFGRFVKRAFPEEGERRSALRRLLPWILVPAGLYGAAKLGDMWGRHAYATENDRGPVSGPLVGLLERMTGRKLQHVGRRNALVMKNDWKSRPLTAENHESLHRTGSLIPAEAFG